MDNGCSVTPRPGSCCYRLEHQRAAGHTFAPGTTVLIVNTGNGVVVSLTVANDGSLTGSIQASTFDRLIVTITDPIGRTATLQRSTFVAADGTTAVGSGGGTVTGPGGLELRVPEGAIGTAATFRIAAVDYAATFPADPPVDLPGGTIGAAMRIETDHPGRFAREIDLAVPRPAAAPDGAFFYVYRRHVGPNGQVRFETLDHAWEGGTGANAKVVTASFPLAGYVVGGLTAGLVMLAWTFDQALPRRPIVGVITGQRTRHRGLVRLPESQRDITASDAAQTERRPQDAAALIATRRALEQSLDHVAPGWRRYPPSFPHVCRDTPAAVERETQPPLAR